MIYVFFFALGMAVGMWLAYRRGWNEAVDHYRDRVVEGAKAQAERDRL